MIYSLPLSSRARHPPAWLPSPPVMGTAPEALTSPQPLDSRRPAAPTLPSFKLPPPNFHTNVKYAHHTIPPPIKSSVSNIPTPPAITQSTTSPTATTAASANLKLAPYWQGQNSYQSGSGAAAAACQSRNSDVASYSSRDAFSPLVSPPNRNPATSTPGTEHISQSYEITHLPPFHHSTSISAASIQWGALQQQQHAMAHATLPAPNPLPDPASSPHALPSNDPYMVKSSSAAPYITAQQSPNPPGAYSSYGQSSIVPNRVASNLQPSHHLNYRQQPWPSYSLPAMNGPICTNIQSPSWQMSLTENGNLQSGALPGLPVYNSAHVVHMPHMQQLCRGHPPHPSHGAPGPTNDRPFKCDKCPQGFHRNYDLKRHKRIHLSVKPFPCTHCGKSFSRKDGLKRHILLKGCGKDGSDGTLKSGEHGGIKEEDQSNETNAHY